jgi:hypothetical protein
MSDITAFAPLYTVTGPNAGQNGTLIPSVTLSATTASQAIALPSGTSTNQVQIANQTAAWAYVNFGVQGSVVAATVAASYPVAPGAVVVVGIAQEVTGATCILAAGATSASVTFTRGNGL